MGKMPKTKRSLHANIVLFCIACTLGILMLSRLSQSAEIMGIPRVVDGTYSSTFLPPPLGYPPALEAKRGMGVRAIMTSSYSGWLLVFCQGTINRCSRQA